MIPRTRVTLTAFIGGTDSGAATFRGLASDGNYYWIKAPNNPQGSRSLIPERVVTHIGLLLGAPVRPIALIDIPDGMGISYRPGYPLRAGVAHGSLELGASKVIDDWRGLANRDGNRERAAYLSALWDLCEGVDPQWLSEFDGDAAIWSFDHGFWFAGEVDWSPSQMSGGPWEHPSIDTASRAALLAAAQKVEALTLNSLQEVTSDVPVEWGTNPEEMSALARTIYNKVPGVAERLRRAAENCTHP